MQFLGVQISISNRGASVSGLRRGGGYQNQEKCMVVRKIQRRLQCRISHYGRADHVSRSRAETQRGNFRSSQYTPENG